MFKIVCWGILPVLLPVENPESEGEELIKLQLNTTLSIEEVNSICSVGSKEQTVWLKATLSSITGISLIAYENVSDPAVPQFAETVDEIS